MSYIVVSHKHTPDVAHAPGCMHLNRQGVLPQQMAMIISAGTLPCRHCLMPNGDERPHAQMLPKPMPVGRYRVVNKALVPLECPACSKSVMRLNAWWACTSCPWQGRVNSKTWKRVGGSAWSGQYRMERQGGRKRVLVPVACPKCGGLHLERERSSGERPSRLWSCASCSWIGSVSRATWELVRPEPKKKQTTPTTGHYVPMRSRKGHADRLG